MVGVGAGAVDVLIVVGFAVDDGFTDTVDDLIGDFEEVGLAEAADDCMDDEGLPPPLLAPSARILAAACSARTTM